MLTRMNYRQNYYGENISPADEEWLDHEANMVDKQHILDKLEASSDYERGLKWLGGAGKATVMRLRELAGELVKVAGNKQKCTFNFVLWKHVSLTYFW